MRTWIALVSILIPAIAAEAQTTQTPAAPPAVNEFYEYERKWNARMGFGVAFPKGRLREETTTGWRGSVGLYRDFSRSLALGFKVDYSKFNGADTMPSGFSASQTRMSIDTVYNFSTFDDGRVQTYISAGAGAARNTLNFGESDHSEWKPGVSAGLGLDIGFQHSDSVTMSPGAAAFFLGGYAEYTNYGTFEAMSVSLDIKLKWGGQ